MLQSVEEILEELSEEEKEKPQDVSKLAFERSLRIDKAGNMLEIESPEGNIELRVKITPEGPVLSFNSTKISMNSDADVSLQCKKFHLKTSEETKIESGGDLRQQVAGNLDVHVRDDIHTKAQQIVNEAELGGIEMKANDDVILNGLRVLMNVPSDEEIEEKRRQIKSFKDFLEQPAEGFGNGRRFPTSSPRERPDWPAKADEEE